MSERLQNFLDSAAVPRSSLSAREAIVRLSEQARAVIGAHTAMLNIFELPNVCPIAATTGQDRGGDVAPFAALFETESRPIRIVDLALDRRTRDLADSLLPKARSFLGAPVRRGSETIGGLCLFDKDGGVEFTQEDEVLVALFASQAAFAIDLLQQVESLQRRGRFFEALVAQSPDAMMFFEAIDALVYANNATSKWGLTPIPLVDNLYHRRGARFTLDELPGSRALRGESVEGQELEVVLPDATRLDVRASAAPVRSESGKTIGAVVTLRNVSVEVELERLRAEFAAIMVHDLRNPLNVLLLSVESLLAAAEGDRVVAPIHVLRRIHQVTRRTAVLVSELLDASRVELGRLSLMPKVVDLPSVISDLVADISPSLRNRTVEIEQRGRPGPVFIDPIRLIQILTNLIENSAKYSLEGAPIRVTLSEAESGTLISISDRGPGIDPEDLPRLFDRFFQSERAREHRQTGLGLGLYITKGLVEAGGGRITVESVAGEGSTFHVWLPEPRLGTETHASPPH
jgi:signal transduction histidine kinase